MSYELEDELLNRFYKRFNNYNNKVLIELGNIIKEIGELIPKDVYRMSQQLKYNTTIDELKKELANITGKSVKEIEIILEKIAKDNIEFASTYYKARALDVPIYEEHKELQKLVKSIVKATQETFVNMAKSTGFKLLDSNKKPVFLNIEETYHKIIDEAVYAVTTGKSTYTEQMRNITKQLANSGVRVLEYESGYTRRLDSAIRMNMMDTIKKTSNETNALFGKEFGSDGVEITVELDPAPDHEDIQGHQFSNEEFEKFQNHVDCYDYKGKFISHKKGKYDRRKISEWNCRHRANPIVLGIDNPFHTDKELQDIIDKNHKGVEIEGKRYTNYEARQLQRQIETEIRKNKETYITARGAGDEELMSKAEYKVRLLGKKYKSICKQGNLKEDNERLYVPNYKNPKAQFLLYRDLTEQLKNMKVDFTPEERRLNYSIDSKGNKHDDFFFEKDKDLVEEITCQKKLEEITGYKVYLNPKTHTDGCKTPDFWIEDTNELWDLKGIDGNSKNVIDNILHNASDKFQTSNIVLKQRKTSHEINYLREKLKDIFEKNQRQKIKQVILLDENENVVVYYKR